MDEQENKLTIKYEKGELIFKGIRPCPSCGKAAEVRVTYEMGFTFMSTQCSYENKRFRILIGKGKVGRDWKAIPDYWPKRTVKTIDDFLKDKDDYNKNVYNVENVKLVFFYITSRCNSNCRICHAHDVRKDLSHHDMGLPFFKERISKYKNKDIILIGGEPTVRDDLPEFINIVRHSGNTPLIWTNGLKLADKEYVKIIKKNGVKTLFLSFDGFDTEYYAKIRGGRQDYDLKIKALNNLKREKINVILNVTLVKGYNDRQVYPIIQYAKDNDFVQCVILNSLCLFGKEDNFLGLSLNNLLSREEMIDEVCKSLNISKEMFELWNDIKIEGALLLQKLFPQLHLPAFWRDVIYFKRKKDGIVPFLNIEQMENIKNNLKQSRIRGVAGLLKISGSIISLINFALFHNNENRLLSTNRILKISVVSSSLSERCFAGDIPVTAIGEKEDSGMSFFKPDTFILLHPVTKT